MNFRANCHAYGFLLWWQRRGTAINRRECWWPRLPLSSAMQIIYLPHSYLLFSFSLIMDLRLCHNQTQIWKRFLRARGISERMELSEECNRLGSVSSQQKFEAMDVKALGPSQLSDSPCYSSRTDQFHLGKKRKYILEAWGHDDPKEAKRASECAQAEVWETPGPLAPLFMFFPSPGPALCKLGQPGVLFVPPEVLTQVLGPSFVLFLRAFPFLVF